MLVKLVTTIAMLAANQSGGYTEDTHNPENDSPNVAIGFVNSGGQATCSGVMLSSQHLLTVGHCLNESDLVIEGQTFVWSTVYDGTRHALAKTSKTSDGPVVLQLAGKLPKAWYPSVALYEPDSHHVISSKCSPDGKYRERHLSGFTMIHNKRLLSNFISFTVPEQEFGCSGGPLYGYDGGAAEVLALSIYGYTNRLTKQVRGLHILLNNNDINGINRVLKGYETK